jgi:two-component system cell cycle response regulator
MDVDVDVIGQMRPQQSASSRLAAHDGHIPATERRTSPRVKVLKKGKLILPNNISVFDCTIRDVSETGARLRCEQTGLLPNELQLMFHAIREVRYVRVVWRRNGELGVQFLTPPRTASNLHI